MVTSDFRPEVEIRPFRACAVRNASGHNYWNSSFIIDVAMWQIPRSTERISSIFVNPPLISQITHATVPVKSMRLARKTG